MPKHNLVPVILNMNDEYWLQYALKSIAGFFPRYVIYDVGSTDRSKDIIDWFVQSEKKRADIFVRYLPFVDPIVQGTFRNSMIAEAASDYYMIVDSDEIYKPEHLREIIRYVSEQRPDRLYGIVQRVEIVEEWSKQESHLDRAYGVNQFLPHHRVYSRDAFWTGKHPGEDPAIPQKSHREYVIPSVTCYHFHNTSRSTKDSEVPKRIERRTQGTYHRGELLPLEVVKELPVLLEKIEDFPVNPSLKRIHDSM